MEKQPRDRYELALPLDADVNRSKVFRNAGISQESYQRAKCLTHSTQVLLCKKRVKEIQAKQRQQEEFRQSKNDAQFTEVHLIKTKLLDMIDNDSTEGLLVNCCIEYFARVKSAELAAFIYAHDPEVKLKKQIQKTWAN